MTWLDRFQTRALFSPRLLALCLACLPAGSALADEPAIEEAAAERSRILYIDIPVPLGTTPADDAGRHALFPIPGLAPATPQRAGNLAAYRNRIAAIEDLGGVWDQNLVEQLTALGRLHQQQGEHAEAIALFQRAMHINRINAGLHHMGQVDAVQSLVESHAALANWEEVDLYQDYLFYVQQRALAAKDPLLVGVFERLGNWQLNAFTLGFGEVLGLRLSAAQLLFNGAAELVGDHYGREDARYVRNLQNVARSAFLVARYPEYVLEIDRPDYRAEQDQLRARLDTLQPAIPRGYPAGRDALLEIVDLYGRQGGPSLALAAALLDLADWHILFDRRQAAEELYVEAWETASAVPGSEDWRAERFQKVQPVPVFARRPTNLVPGSGESLRLTGLRSDYADVSMTITEFGAPRDIEVVSAETHANHRQLNQLRREIRSTRFRPLLTEGEPKRSAGHVFRYRYWY